MFGLKREVQKTGENCMVRSFVICTVSKYYSDEQIQKYAMGATYCIYGE
jgi:hypothetical protein